MSPATSPTFHSPRPWRTGLVVRRRGLYHADAPQRPYRGLGLPPKKLPDYYNNFDLERLAKDDLRDRLASGVPGAKAKRQGHRRPRPREGYPVEGPPRERHPNLQPGPRRNPVLRDTILILTTYSLYLRNVERRKRGRVTPNRRVTSGEDQGRQAHRDLSHSTERYIEG